MHDGHGRYPWRDFLQQALEKQIAFADHQEVYALLGDKDAFLQILRDSFDCQMICRGGVLSLMGEAAEVRQAAQVMEELQYLYRQGTTVTTHEVRYGIRLVREGKGETLHQLFGDTILVTSRGHHVKPKTLGQRHYLDLIRREPITFGIGPAGTGKTYLAVVMAVAALRNKEVHRIILTRPAVEAGERLGFLPGDLQDKVDPYLRPLYDALEDILGLDTYRKFMTKNIIEIAPLAYMRGRTLEDAFVILDEAQNTTGKQMKMFLTRLGFGSKMVVTGDLGQVDLPRGVPSGLRQAAEVLQGVKGIGIARLAPADVIRHDVVTRIVEAYGRWEQQKQQEKHENHEIHEKHEKKDGQHERNDQQLS